MATLGDIAKVAGVSKSTVYRAIRGKGDVKSHVAERVMKVADEVGYSPRPTSRRIDGQDVGNIGVIFYDTRKSAALTANLLYSLDKKFSSLNSSMLMAKFDGSGALPDFIKDKAVSGLIIRPGGHFEQIEERLPNDIPVVWIFEDNKVFLDKDYDSVLPNESQVASLACDYLKAKGCAKIAAINIFPSHTALKRRVRNISTFAEDNFQACYTVNEDRPEEEIIEELFTRDPEISGLFVAGGTIEVTKAYMSLLRIGRKPCEDVHLVTCSEEPDVVDRVDPRICKLDLSSDEVVNTAVDTLIWRINNPDSVSRVIYIKPKLY